MTGHRSPGTADAAVLAEVAAMDLDAVVAAAMTNPARFACRQCADTFDRAHDAIAHATTTTHVTYGTGA